MKNLENELADIHRQMAILKNEMNNVVDAMRKLENYVQEWFSEDSKITE